MEAKSQQNFYNKAAIVVISSTLSLWRIHFQDLVQKVMKWLIIIHYSRGTKVERTLTLAPERYTAGICMVAKVILWCI